METFAELLARGETSYLVAATVAFAAAVILGALAVRIRPRSRRRSRVRPA